MRAKERIPIFLKFLFEENNVTILIKEIYKLELEESIYRVVSDIYDAKTYIEDCWMNNPDWRFSQVLVNLYHLPNISGFWYYIEEDEILEKLGMEPREYLLWGQNYDKNMNLLPSTIYKPIKDLETDHIQAILDGEYTKNPKYIKCFEEELKLRHK